MSPCSDFHSVLSEHPILIFGLTPCKQTFLQILWIVWYLFICTVDVNMFKFFWQILPLYALFIPSNITDPSLNNLIICKCTYSCFFLMLLTFPVLCWPSHKFLWSCPSFIYRLCYLTNNIFQTHLSADFLWIKTFAWSSVLPLQTIWMVQRVFWHTAQNSKETRMRSTDGSKSSQKTKKLSNFRFLNICS